MPRTKKPKPSNPNNLMIPSFDREKMLKTFHMYASASKAKLEKELELQLEKCNDAYQMLLAQIGNVDLPKTVQQLRDEYAKANITPPTVSKFAQPPGMKSMSSQRSVSSNRDDGYVTDAGRSRHKKNTRLSRSLERSNATATSGYCDSSSLMGPPTEWRKMGRKRSSSVNSGVIRNCYRTPANARTNGGTQFAPITPKVTPNAPMTVLRRPRQGEMAVSLSGSPLLVNSISTIDDQANCNIPLEDGTMISLLPSLMRASTAHIPFEYMHDGVLQQLSTLRNNIDLVVRMGQKK